MATEEREPMELLDELYSLGYWMTGSLKKTNDLVLETYRNVDSDTPEIEVFKTFRDVYYERFGLDGATSQPEASRFPDESLLLLVRQQETDRKLSVLLSAVCGLKHRTISIILGKPLDTVRLWLSSGRKSMVDGLMIFLTCLQPAIC